MADLAALKFPFTLPPLPYAKDALHPHMSSETFDYHYGKHHQTYITNLNGLVENDEELKGKSLKEIIEFAKANNKPGLFNQSAQHFNHAFFWNCLKSQGGGKPQGELAKKIDEDFGSYEAFHKQFRDCAVTHFGSGWAFLTYNKATHKLAVEGHHDASTPFVNNTVPLFTIDSWEHAYYIDYRNVRANFVDAILNNLANWDYAEKNFQAAL